MAVVAILKITKIARSPQLFDGSTKFGTVMQKGSFNCPNGYKNNNNDRLTAFDPGQPG